MNPLLWERVSEALSKCLDRPFQGRAQIGPGGGCINQSFVLDEVGSDRRFFVKINRASLLDMFAAEFEGLNAIAATGTIRVPKPLCYGQWEETAFLAMEWLTFSSGGSASWQALGRDLAKLHATPIGEHVGWTRANYIGATPQMNPVMSDWSSFFWEHRLLYQIRLAEQRGGFFRNLTGLESAVSVLLGDHEFEPSLVHGDLWSGNAGFCDDGSPVIFDAAVYWGDPEVDLAMSRLFGGFPQAFYAGYRQIISDVPDWERREILYNLYHILNHYNLFGGSYLDRAQAMIEDLCRSA